MYEAIRDLAQSEAPADTAQRRGSLARSARLEGRANRARDSQSSCDRRSRYVCRMLGQLGDYTLLRKFPEGGNADVYVAVRAGSTAEVVVKRLRARPGTEPWKRFMREVRTVRALGDFAGVLPIEDSYLPESAQADERAWYSMPLAVRADEVLAGASLDTVIAAVASFAETLERLHVRGHHHRDIKPANLYQLDGNWLVGDFGLVDIPDAEAITEAGRKLGPANFLPYELIMDPDNADGGPADVYELAKTLWVLATGVRFAPLGPQPAGHGAFSLEHRTGGHPLAADLDRLIDACTRTEPELRPTMRQLASDLKAWLAMSQRRQHGQDLDPLRDVGAELRAVFWDDLTAGQLQERKKTLARHRITSLGYGVEQLSNALGRPGAVTLSNYNATVAASLTRHQTDQLADPVMTGMSIVVVRLRSGPRYPELLLAVAAELEEDGTFAIEVVRSLVEL